MRSRFFDGFTLLKFLAVIALLVIVAAILFPIFARHRESDVGGWPRCPGNLKQIALGYMQYAQDYNEKLPPIGKVSAGVDNGWVVALQPYIKSEQIFRCPTVGFPRGATTSVSYTSYYINSNVAGKSINQINIPGETVFFGEGEPASSNYACSNLSSCAGLNAAGRVGPIPRSALERHQGGSYFAFGDGHVTLFSPETVRQNEKKMFGL